MIRNGIKIPYEKAVAVQVAIDTLEGLLEYKLFFRDNNGKACFRIMSIMDGERVTTGESICYNVIDYTPLEEIDAVTNFKGNT